LIEHFLLFERRNYIINWIRKEGTEEGKREGTSEERARKKKGK
jgi:hypothetical protein